MLKRLLNVIGFLALLIFGVYIIIILWPVPFPEVEGMGKIDPDASKTFTKLPSGVKYRILRKGNDKRAGDIDNVMVMRKEWISSGHVTFDGFDKNIASNLSLRLPPYMGYKEVLQSVGEGGLIESIIPPNLALGKRGHRLAKTPNNSSLHSLILMEKINGGFPATEPGKIDDDVPEEYTTTKSGLKYKILRKSDGPIPKRGDLIAAHYTAMLGDGTEFESTYKRGFANDLRINEGEDGKDGFGEGIQKIGVGGMIEIIIPPELGYGANLKEKIPANSTLHYIVEIMDIRDPGYKKVRVKKKPVVGRVD